MNGAVVRVYSLAKDGGNKITNHFRVREFRCKDGSDAIFVADGLAAVLEQIRCHFGKETTITSGYRTHSHNAKQKGSSKHSQHLYGLAADIVVAGVDPEKVADYAETLLPGTGGIGRYDDFTHIDVRSTKSRWRG